MIGCMDGSGYLDDWMIGCVEGIDVIEAMKTLLPQPVAPLQSRGPADIYIYIYLFIYLLCLFIYVIYIYAYIV